MKAKPYQLNALVPRLQKEFAAALVFAIILCNVILIVRVAKLKNAGRKRKKVRKSPDSYIR